MLKLNECSEGFFLAETETLLPRTYEFYRNALAGERLPAAFVDLDLLYANSDTLIGLSNELPIRLATKSIRSTGILRLLMNRSANYQGLMAYSAREAAYLIDQGFNDILIAYPTVEISDIEAALHRCQSGARITFMLDCLAQAKVLSDAAAKTKCLAAVCIDIDMSVPLPGIFFGVKRSPLRDGQKILELMNQVSALPHLQLRGIMGYEAQMAGVPDRHPVKHLQNIVVRLLKHTTWGRVRERRQTAARHLQTLGVAAPLINGGGTGSLQISSHDTCLTEVTAGSGLYAPRLFDFYDALPLQPAAGFVLPVTRKPDGKTVTCHGGGYIASGAAGLDRLPVPYLPNGLTLSIMEGAGEVQTPLSGRVAGIEIGDPVLFRHAKAGELCEHFNELLLIENGKIIGRAPTYRGEGQSFL